MKEENVRIEKQWEKWTRLFRDTRTKIQLLLCSFFPFAPIHLEINMFWPVPLSVLSTSACVCTVHVSCLCWCLLCICVAFWIGLCRLLSIHWKPSNATTFMHTPTHVHNHMRCFECECECAHNNCKCECVSKATYAFVHFPAIAAAAATSIRIENTSMPCTM